MVSRGEEKSDVIIDTDSVFTLIAEQKFPEDKACGRPDIPRWAEQRSESQDETDPKKTEAGTTSNQGAAGGEVEQTQQQ